MKKERIDKLIVESGFSDSLKTAQALVMSGKVLVDEQRVDKPSELFSSESVIRIKGEAEKHKYVGRGGLKLERALNDFHIQPNEYVCLDVGASTGGFTDCLLQNGAKKVISVDVGTNQIVWKLRNDEKVEVRENTNARNLKPEDFAEKFDLIVSNPPYISSEEMKTLQREVRDFEPHVALTDGKDGLSIVEKIIGAAPNFLKADGFLLLEIGFNQAIKVKEMFDKTIWREIEILPDLQNILRMVKAKKGTRGEGKGRNED